MTAGRATAYSAKQTACLDKPAAKTDDHVLSQPATTTLRKTKQFDSSEMSVYLTAVLDVNLFFYKLQSKAA